jgi:hypothetical protein
MAAAHDNTAATLAIPAGLEPCAAHWLPVHLSGLKGGSGGMLTGLSDAELGPFAPAAAKRAAAAGDKAEEEAAAAAPAAAAAAAAAAQQDDAHGSDQQQQAAASRAGSAPATAALQATLRGRELAGARWPLPPGVGGLVLEPAPELDVAAEADGDEEAQDEDEDDEYGGYGGRRRQQQQGGEQQGKQQQQAPRQRSWRAVAAFDELVSWNHDTLPAPTDAAWRLMDFLAVSAAAHMARPITKEEVDAEVAVAGGVKSGDGLASSFFSTRAAI